MKPPLYEKVGLTSNSAQMPGETWAKGYRAGEDQAAETLGEAGYHEAAAFLRESFMKERALEKRSI